MRYQSLKRSFKRIAISRIAMVALFAGFVGLTASGCGQNKDNSAEGARVTVSLAARSSSRTFAARSASRSLGSVPLTEAYPFLDHATLLVFGGGYTTASINAEYNRNQLSYASDGKSLLITETEFSLNVPGSVQLTFVVTAFNLDGYRIFQGSTVAGPKQFASSAPVVSVPLKVNIDEAVPALASASGCADSDLDGICDDYEDIFVNSANSPDIDGDGVANSLDDDSDDDGMLDADEGILPSNDGFPLFIHKNQPPTGIDPLVIETEQGKTSSGVQPHVNDPDVGDSHQFEISVQPSYGTAWTTKGFSISLIRTFSAQTLLFSLQPTRAACQRRAR